MTTAPTPDGEMAAPDRLAQMIGMQRALQKEAYGSDIGSPDLEPSRRMALIRDHHLSCENELHEALGETGWKPWATSNHIRQPAFNGEMVDAWHFFMNLLLVANPGRTDAEIAELLYSGYMIKRDKNRKRQAEGYDGVTGKCPVCGRALDDDGTDCFRDVFKLKGISFMEPVIFAGVQRGKRRTKANGFCHTIGAFYADGEGAGDFRVLDQ